MNWLELLKEDPTNELVRWQVAKMYFDARKFSEAVPHLEKLVQDQNDYALAWAYLARAALEAGDKDKAVHAIKHGMPHAIAQKHEVPMDMLLAVEAELDSGF